MPRTRAKLTAKKLESLHSQLNIITSELNSAFLEKSEEIEGLLIGVIANENVVMVGSPGEAKSNLTECFTSLIGGTTWAYQLGAFTQPDDIFGIESLKELRENDRKVIKTAHMAPSANLVYLDEVFKANNSMMNSLLLLLNERKVDIGEGTRLKTENRMVVGTSNEYPEDSELAAFWDRWAIRFDTKTLQSDDSFDYFWENIITGSIGVVDTKKAMKLSDIDLLRDSIRLVDSSCLTSSIKKLRFELMRNNIVLSTRKWGKIKKILHAVALRHGRLTSKKRDLNFLRNVIWRNPTEIKTVDNCISESIGGDLNLAKKALALARRIYQELASANLPENKPQAIAFLAQKKDEIEQVERDAEKLDLDDPQVAAVFQDIKQIRISVAQQLSNIINNRS